MRIIQNENEDWFFHKERDEAKEHISLPYTWNAHDCGLTYDRTTAWYEKELYIERIYEGKKIYLEFGAAGISAELYINGCHVPYAKYDIYNIGNEIVDGLCVFRWYDVPEGEILICGL